LQARGGGNRGARALTLATSLQSKGL